VRLYQRYIALGLLSVAVLCVACAKKKSAPTAPTTQQFNTTTLASLNQIGIPQLRAGFHAAGPDSGKFDMAFLALNYDDNAYWLSTSNCRMKWYVPFKDGSGKGYTVTLDSVTRRTPTLSTICVHMLMDGSSSLLATDPSSQRKGAGKLFVTKMIRKNPNHLMAVAEFGRYAPPDFDYFLWKDFAAVSDSINFFHAFDALGCSLSTPLYSGVIRSLQWTNQWVSGAAYNRAVLVFTDGGDNSSEPGDNLASATALASSLGIPIYVVGLSANPGDVNDVDMTTLAFSTGGIYAKATNPDDLRSIFGVMAAGMTNGYNILTARVSPVPPSGTALVLQTTVIDQADTTNKKSVVSSYAIP
jgi:hypothetical protein